MKIAINFDSTCVKNDFPKIGEDIGAVEVLRDLVSQGHKLILSTMRSDGQRHGDVLTEAIGWFADNEIQLYSVGKDKGQEHWTSSNKCFADLYIGDDALGCPLIYPDKGKPYVNWVAVKETLKEKGILKY